MSGKPGRSGGKRARAGRKPGPVSAAKRELADLAKAHAAAALQTLVSIHSDTEQSAAARVSAAVAILDRGYGRPAQMLAHTGKDDEEIKRDIVITIVDPKERLVDVRPLAPSYPCSDQAGTAAPKGTEGGCVGGRVLQ